MLSCSKHLPVAAAQFLFTMLLLGVFSLSARAETGCSIAESALKKVSKVRGLEPLRKVQCRVQSKEEVRAYLNRVIETKVPPERIKGEEAVFKLLGIIPTEYDYKKGLVELYTANLGGYYEPELDFYAMADWLDRPAQQAVALHEQVHALQDQHFIIDNLLDHRKLTTDQLLARSALVEGDATAVTIDHSLLASKQPPLSGRKEISSEVLNSLGSAVTVPFGKKTPPGLKKLMVFPYVSGLRFVHSLMADKGYGGVNDAFDRLPDSTEQIMNPQFYLEGGMVSQKISLPGPEDGEEYPGKPYFSDTLGEFFIFTLLSERIGNKEARDAASGWNGDKIGLYAIKNSQQSAAGKGKNKGNLQSKNSTNTVYPSLMLWVTAWDKKGDAEEFFQAIAKAFSGRFNVPYNWRPSKYYFLSSEFGKITLELKKSRVLIVFTQ